jgi:rhodanese-related sulfurtransferase
VLEVDLDAFATAQAGGALVIDVREPDGSVAGGTSRWRARGLPVVAGRAENVA